MAVIIIDYELDKRDKAILECFKEIFDVVDSRDENLPDLVIIAKICFEAGRKFQRDNPNFEVSDSCTIYLND